MRYAVINNLGVVENVIVAAEGHAIAGMTLVATDVAAPGWTWNGAQFSAPEPTPSPVPTSVTPLQARKALLAAGVLDQVQAYVALQPQSVQLAWDYALEIRRSDPMINAAVDALEWTRQQLDDLFIAAAAL